MKNKIYVPVNVKLNLAILGAMAWFLFSLYVSIPWINDLANIITLPGAIFVVTGLALLPGIMNSFLITGLILDRRPSYVLEDEMPPISILVAAYNEEDCIKDTLFSVVNQNYPGPVEVIVCNDGSADNTAAVVNSFIYDMEQHGFPIEGSQFDIRLMDLPENVGKARALNMGLATASHDLIITMDADSYVYKDGLAHLTANLIYGPDNTAAVAGTVLTRNSRQNWITKLQEWDYFLGIAVVKRIQSLFQGTLVAQGAFSIYTRESLDAVGGWDDTVGEDIVLTWKMRDMGYRVAYAENAFAFTNVPDTYKQFYHQRKRWSRGLMEALRACPKAPFRLRMNMPFIHFNMMFPYLDLVYLFAFIPGVIAAVFFEFYAIVGLMTLLLLPLALTMNIIMYFKQKHIFELHGLRVRKNMWGFVGYMLFYQLLMTPASLMGYISELLNHSKSWGTK